MPIALLSPASAVRMADEWFAIADDQHFWLRRRFQVFRNLVGRHRLLDGGRRWAEFGCGHGVVLRQCRESFGVRVRGFDLDRTPLELAARDASLDLAVYDVFDRREDLAGAFDGILLFDVLEHIPDAAGFLAAVGHHLAPGGWIAVNVPALMSLYSRYDEVAGHVRRYRIGDLRREADEAGLTVVDATYWGAPLLPAAWARCLVMARTEREKVIERGFRPPSRMVNAAMGLVARLEHVPQRLVGTSVMAILRRASAQVGAGPGTAEAREATP